MTIKKLSFGILFIILAAFTVVSVSYAQVQLPKEKKDEDIYYSPSLKNFAKTYWRFAKFDINDDEAIDMFMFISECNLYNEYHHNEFEWNGIRKSTRKFLTDNKKKFPSRYRLVQPISLGDYDFDKGGFNIAEEHRIEGLKRFEIGTTELFEDVCGTERPIEGYPRAIALELTRPFIFNFFKMDQNIAKEVIDTKMEEYEKLPAARKNRTRYLSAREVYLSAKVKIFAYKEGDVQSQFGYRMAKMLGILERVEIYEDSELTNLLYAKDYRVKNNDNVKDF